MAASTLYCLALGMGTALATRVARAVWAAPAVWAARAVRVARVVPVARVRRRAWAAGAIRTFAAAGLAMGPPLLGLAPDPAAAQGAVAGDVYYKVHVDQSYKPGPFVQDLVVWESVDLEGIAPSFAARHDSLRPAIAVAESVTFEAVAGRFTADLFTQIVLSARTGIWNSLVNTLRVEVYVKGSTGTPYHVELAGFGDLTVSRQGGRNGSLQSVNGISSATFMGTTATIDSSGAISQAVFEPLSFEGYSLGEITVEAETYSYVGVYVFQAPAQVTQTYCILGCMTEAADFEATSFGHVQLHVYPCLAPLKRPASGGDGRVVGATEVPCAEVPTAAPGAPDARRRVELRVAPNPFNPATVVSFQGHRGAAARVEVLDARGRQAACLFVGPATGAPQRLTWQARGLASGVYLLRVECGGEQRSQKLTLLK